MAQPTYTPDYSKRTHSVQRNTAVMAGYAVDAVHIPPGSINFPVALARTVLVRTSINVAPGGGAVILSIGGDIVMEASGARDYNHNCYASKPIFISTPGTGEDVTVYVAPSSKGSVAGQ